MTARHPDGVTTRVMADAKKDPVLPSLLREAASLAEVLIRRLWRGEPKNDSEAIVAQCIQCPVVERLEVQSGGIACGRQACYQAHVGGAERAERAV